MEGGSAGWGTIFDMSATGAEHVLYSFKAGNDGAYPFDALKYLNGKFYGTTKEGGTAGFGTVFDATTSGQEHVLYSFKAGKDGAYPYASLIDFKGELYGTTYQGGAPNWGTLFKVGTSGKESVLHAFQAQDHGGTDGAYPFARLTELNSRLFGAAQGGGVDSGWGTLYSITP